MGVENGGIERKNASAVCSSGVQKWVRPEKRRLFFQKIIASTTASVSFSKNVRETQKKTYFLN